MGHKKADCRSERPHVDQVSKFVPAPSDTASSAGSFCSSNASTGVSSAGSYHIGAVAPRGIQVQGDGDWYCGHWDRSEECVLARTFDMGILHT